MKQASPSALERATVDAALRGELARWQVIDTHLERCYQTGGWRASLMIANAIGHLAEVAWHHPELLLAYGSVTVRLQTHETGAITRRDLALARRIEALICWQPNEADDDLTGLPDEPSARYLISEL
ncbi:MAG: 4a-hydroxytetrahydrobiopterin dehydratase [Burkholderiaceae bacterium]